MADMKLTINYCTSWGYRAKAASLAGELTKQFQIKDVEMVPSSGGTFDVRMNDKLVFSKHEEGRFPEPGEVEHRITEILS